MRFVFAIMSEFIAVTCSVLSSTRRSTYRRYALSVGIRPADVCGWMMNPISSRSDISFRIVAELRFRSVYFEIVLEPTGSPVFR